MEGWWKILEISAGEDHGVFLLRGAWPQAIKSLRRVVIYKVAFVALGATKTIH